MSLHVAERDTTAHENMPGSLFPIEPAEYEAGVDADQLYQAMLACK
jgi:hypothetical protein